MSSKKPTIKDSFRGPTASQERGMKAFLWDGFFTGGLETIFLHYLPLFAFAYGASNGEIGLLIAAASLGAATASLPGAWLSTRWRHRMPFILLTRGLLSNLFILPLAVIPLLLGEPVIVGTVIAAAAMRSFSLYLAEGAWTSLAADMVPAQMRGRFFVSRNLMVGAGSLAGIAAVALLLAGLGPGSEWSAVWFVAVALGVGATVMYACIPERELPERPQARVVGAGWKGVLEDANFRRYGATVLLWNVSLFMAAPFFNVHLVKNLGASPLWVGLLLVITAVFGLFGQKVFGRLIDARGARRLVVPTGAAIAMLPLMWFFVSSPWQVVPINIVGGLIWSGYMLANFSFLLSISPPGQERFYGAAYTTIAFLSMTLGPLLGGALAAAYGIKWVFVVSGLGRLAAVGLFAGAVADRAEPPDEAPKPAQPQVATVEVDGTPLPAAGSAR